MSTLIFWDIYFKILYVLMTWTACRSQNASGLILGPPCYMICRPRCKKHA